MPEPAHCDQCGAPLTDGLGSRCPRCLLRLALGEVAEEGLPVGAGARYGTPTLGVFGDYELLEEVAHGGMGVVFKARQRSLGRFVAVKMIRAGRLASADEVQRFRSEAEAAAQLQHPNIVAIHEVGEQDGQHFFSMDFVEGCSLAKRVLDGPLPPVKAARYVKTLAEAVHYAHRHGVLHRDLKPSNVLIDAQDEPRITDFGLAKRLERSDDLTPGDHPLGTPGYMSPEQAAGQVRGITTAADVYGLGAILYDLLTGRPPFVAESPLATMQRVLEGDPPRPGVLCPHLDRDLETICLKCLEKTPARRYASAAALAEEIDHWLRHEPIQARPGGLWRHAAKWARRRPAVTVLLAALLGGAVLFVAELTASRVRVQAALARMRIHVAEDYFRDQPSIALAYLARVLRDDPGNAVAAERLLSALSQRQFLLPRTPALRHAAAVKVARFSPDGRWVVTASDDGTAQVWDAVTGAPASPPLRHGGPVRWAEFSPDGAWVATASADGSARLWDARTGTPRSSPLRHTNGVNATRFSPDGRWLATAGDDHTARLWAVADGAPKGLPLAHQERVFAVQFSPDGRTLLTAAGDSSAGLWEVATGERRARLAHANWVCAAEFSPDGRRVVTGSFDRTVRVWDAQSGAPVTPPLHHRAALRSVQFSPDGRWLLTGTMSGTAEVWDWQSSTVEQAPQAVPRPVVQIELNGSAVFSARFSPHGNRLAVASVAGTVQLWDPRTGQRLGEPMRHGGAVFSVQFSPDGASLLTASADHTARIWDARPANAPGRTLTQTTGSELRALTDAAFSHDGSQIAAGSEAGAVRRWKVACGEPVAVLLPSHPHAVTAVRFSPDGRMLLTTARDNAARLCPIRNGGGDGLVLRHECSRPGFSGAEFSPDGSAVLTGAYCGAAELWDAATGARLGARLHLPTKGDIRCVTFSRDGRWFAASDDGGTARVWETANPANAGPVLVHREAVNSVRFSPDGRRMVTASWDATAQVWDRASGRPLTPPLRHLGRVVAAEFSPDGRRVLTASYDHTARLWDAHTGQPLAEPLRHDDWVVFASFAPDGRRVATASLDGTGRLWDTRTGLPLSEPLRHPAGATLVRFSPDGALLLSAGRDGTARLWPVLRVSGPAPGWLMDLAEALAGQRLDTAGQLQSLPVDGLLPLQQRLRLTVATDCFSRWARWFFTEPPLRPALVEIGL
jgi:WD40 repeat protein/tRNA A-37 threonylcarbamoyl transferase component Bud32